MSSVSAAAPGFAHRNASTRRGPDEGQASYIDIYRASPLERIALIKAGIRATQAKRIVADLALSQGTVLAALNLSTATMNRKVAQDQMLSADEGERVIGMAKLIGQVAAMVEESGDVAGFGAAAWVSRWLGEPLPAIGGIRPIDLLDTMEGQALVGTALAQIQSGAYA